MNKNKFAIVGSTDYAGFFMNEFNTKKTFEEFMAEIKKEYLKSDFDLRVVDVDRLRFVKYVEDLLEDIVSDTDLVYTGHAVQQCSYDKAYVMDMKNKTFVEIPKKEWDKEWKDIVKMIAARELKRLSVEKAKQAKVNAIEDKKLAKIIREAEIQRKKERESFEREEYLRLQKKFSK